MLTNNGLVVLLHSLLGGVNKEMAENALVFGEYRGGGAIGFKDEKGHIWSVTFDLNSTLPSRFGKPDSRYSGYAGFKLNTALSTGEDSKNLDKESSRLEAIHEGAVVYDSPSLGVLIGVAYSGHHGYEDKEIALKILTDYFVLNSTRIHLE